MKQYFTRVLLFITFVVAVVASTVAVVYLLENRDLKTQIEQLRSSSASSVSVSTSTSRTASDSCLTQSANARIQITQPCPEEEINDTFVVQGTALNVFEATLDYEIVDATGKQIHKGAMTVTGDPDDFSAPYVINNTIRWDSGVATTSTGKLVVFHTAPKDGSRENVVEIPVRFP